MVQKNGMSPLLFCRGKKLLESQITLRNFVVLLNWLEVITKGVIQNKEDHLSDYYINRVEHTSN